MMKAALIVFLVLCAFVVAMVPRDRRALNTEDESWYKHDAKSTGIAPGICARQTPCFWSIYKPIPKTIEFNITNSYCVCASDMVCKITEDDTTVSAYIYHCRLPSEEGLIIDS